MDRRAGLGLLVLVAVIAALMYLDVPAWHGTQTAVVVPPPAAGTTAETPATPAATTDNTPAAASAPAATPPAATTPVAGVDNSQVAMVNPSSSQPAAATPVMLGATVPPTFDIVRVEPSGDTVVAGQAEPESKVEVLDGADSIATAQADQNGAWAMALDKPLAPGSHDFAIRTTSKDKAVATLSDQRVTVSVPEKGSKDVFVVLNAPNAPSKVIEVPGGIAEAAPGNEIAALEQTPAADDKTTKKPGAAEAGAPDVNAPPSGDTQVAGLEASDSAGSQQSSAMLPPPGKAAESATPQKPLSGEPAPVGTETKIASEPPVADEPPVAAEPAVPAEPPVAAVPTPAVVVAAVEADTAGSVYIAGTATTDETVRVYLDDKPLGDAKPSPSGTWLVQTTRDLPAGNYTVRADQVDAGGAVIARSEVPFVREVDVATLKPAGTAGAGEAGATLSGQMPMETVIIKHGDNLWRIARGTWGKGIRWSTIYQANTDQIRNPHWIYPGQVFIMPKGSTTWTD
jgi:nucleoid-associated protein YgaU